MAKREETQEEKLARLGPNPTARFIAERIKRDGAITPENAAWTREEAKELREYMEAGGFYSDKFGVDWDDLPIMEKVQDDSE